MVNNIRCCGVDIGTGFIASAEKGKDPNKVEFRKCRDAFFKPDLTKFMGGVAPNFAENMLKQQKAHYIKLNNDIYILGDSAFKFATTMHQNTLRPMKRGILNPEEKVSAVMVSEIIKAIAGPPTSPEDILFYCVPADPIDSEMKTEYHKEVLRQVFAGMGYKNVTCIHEGLAVVFSELSTDGFTGIGLSFGAGMCLRGNTKIPLLDGTVTTIKELADKGQDNEFWVYSCKEDGTIVPGKARNAHKVKSAELYRVWLDNEKYLDCTGDHKIMLRDGTYREAKDLTTGDSLMPFYNFDARDDVRKNFTEGMKRKLSKYHNHKVVKVEKLGITEDVYDISVDDYHNFAIEDGIFVHNCNLSFSFMGMPLLSFAISRGGDWIDEESAKATNEKPSTLTYKKESGMDIRNPKDEYERAISIHYKALLKYLTDQIKILFKKGVDMNGNQLPMMMEPLPIVVAGGTTLIGGFTETFEEIVKKGLEGVIPIREVRKAEEPIFAVSHGLYQAAKLVITQ